jgi:methylated-DNA-[protein]-cysteine S-methyltransferase
VLPIGWCHLAASGAGLVSIEFAHEGAQPGGAGDQARGANEAAEAILDQAEQELQAYFAGDLREFSVALDLGAMPPFTQRVLDACRRVPYGQTVSYGELAVCVGSPGGARAVGQAMARNPLPLAIPCHRVVGRGGALTGFGGGLPLKASLLALEQGIRGQTAKSSAPRARKCGDARQ